MGRQAVILILLAVFSVNPVWGYQSPTESLVLPYNSAATSDDISAIKFNPAGLGISRGFQTSFFHTFSDSSFEGDNAWLLTSGGLGFSVEWLGNVADRTYRKYTLSGGGKFSRGLFWGTSYSWFGSRHEDYDKLSSWKIGLLARPLEFLSVGAVAKDLNRPRFEGEKTRISFDFGIAVRPAGDRLTLSADASLGEKEKIKKAVYRFRAEVEPLDGFILSGDIDDKGNFGLGGRINLPTLGAGTYNSVTKDYDYNQGTVYLTLSEDRYRTLLKRKNNFVEIQLSGKLVEENSRVGLFGKTKPTMMDLLESIRRAKEDNSVRGMLLRIESLDWGIAKVQEIRDAILDFKTGGKYVIAFMELGGNKEYYLATAADKIVLLPSGYLLLNGLEAEVTFIKGTLEKLGIVADLEHIGDYKSASDLLTRTSMSPAHREVVNSLLDDLYDQITQGIAQSRGWTQEETKTKIDSGPFTATEAKRSNLVDTLLFYDQLDDLIKKSTGLSPHKVANRSYQKRKYYKYSWTIPPKIAVIYATGMISSGESGTNFLLGDYMGSVTVSKAIQKAREDRTIKAIVFRVDSPGGEGIASDVILREIIKTKGVKPFIVSMSDVAGSGGYWISSAADTIVSMPASYTGSIGVISGKLSFQGLYQKIGLNIETVKRGKHADIFSSTRQFNAEEREIMQRQIKEFYSEFVQRVARGRKMSEAEVDSIGRGRVWTGRQAQRNGLVDLLGGLDLALAIAREKAGLPEDSEVEIVSFPERKFSLSISLGTMLSSSPDVQSILDELKKNNIFEDGDILLLTPYSVDIK
ncbi:MAG TPA: signal peptide peptidase SppA [candidate division Zixibacteria bacterium]